jgi:hypothetical protein
MRGCSSCTLVFPLPLPPTAARLHPPLLRLGGPGHYAVQVQREQPGCGRVPCGSHGQAGGGRRVVGHSREGRGQGVCDCVRVCVLCSRGGSVCSACAYLCLHMHAGLQQRRDSGLGTLFAGFVCAALAVCREWWSCMDSACSSARTIWIVAARRTGKVLCEIEIGTLELLLHDACLTSRSRMRLHLAMVREGAVCVSRGGEGGG